MTTSEGVSATGRRQSPERAGWVAVTVLTFLYLLSMLDRNLITLLVAPIKKDLGLTDFQLSFLYGGAFAFFYTVGGLPLGWAIDRFPRRRVIFWAVSAWSLSTAGCGLANNFVSLFAARAGVGAAESALIPGSHSILADSFPPTKLALPVSIYSAGAKVGQSLSLLIGGLLAAIIAPAAIYTLPGIAAAIEGWKLIFIIVGLPGLFFAFAIFIFPEPVRTATPGPARGRGYSEYYRFASSRIAFLAPHHIGQLLYLATSVAITSWMPAFLQRAHGMTATQSGLWFGAALFIATIAGMPVHGLIVDRLYARGMRDAHMRYLIYCALIAAPFGVAAFFVQGPWLSVLCIGIFFLFVCGYTSLPVAALQLVVPGHLRGKAASVQLLVTGFGGITLGPLIVGALTDFVFQDQAKVGWGMALCVILLLPIASLLFYIGLRPMREALDPLPPAVAEPSASGSHRVLRAG